MEAGGLGAAVPDPPQPEDDGSLVLLHNLDTGHSQPGSGWAEDRRGRDRGKTTLKQTQSEKGSVTRTRSQEAAISSQPHTPGPALAPAPELVTEGAGLGGSGGWGCGQGAGQPGSSFSAMVP